MNIILDCKTVGCAIQSVSISFVNVLLVIVCTFAISFIIIPISWCALIAFEKVFNVRCGCYFKKEKRKKEIIVAEEVT